MAAPPPPPPGSGHFSSPPVKVLAAQLKQCKKRPGAPPSFWLERSPGGGELELSVVWMQGRVTQVRPERGTTLRLTDDSHTFTVCGADRVPKGRPCLEPVIMKPKEKTNTGQMVQLFLGIMGSCDQDIDLSCFRDTAPFSAWLGGTLMDYGKYVMVMGSVLSCSPEPILRAVKISDLSDNPVHCTMWKYEVEDLHANIKYS